MAIQFQCTGCGQAIEVDRRVLDWKPRTVFGELVRVMVDADLELAKREAAYPEDLRPL